MPDPQPQTAKQIPMLAPDGTQGMVDADSAQQAVNANYRPALQMRSKSGEKGLVAIADMGQALKSGYMTEGQYTQQQNPTADPNKAGLVSTPLRFLSGGLGAIVGAGKGVYHTLADAPQNDAEQALNNSQGRPGLLAYRALIAPQLDQAAQAVQGAKSGDMQTRIQSGAHALAALIPGAGPMAANVGDSMRPQLEQGNVAGAIGNLGANVGMAYLGNKAVGALAPEATVAGQNYTPSHGAAFEGLLAKANGMGPNFIPQNLTSDALSPIRQSASDMLANGSPVEQGIAKSATARGVQPLDRIGAVHSIIQRSLSDLEAQHGPALAQVSGTPVDMSPIQRGLQSQIVPGMSAADIAGIHDLIQRSGQITNIGELNQFRQIMNEESSPAYRQTPTRAGAASAPQQVATDTANAVRAHYFDQMQQATGTDFQPLKSQESKLLTTKEAIERMQSPEAKAEATFNAGGKSYKEVLGDVANVIKDPRTTVTQTLLRESPATRSANLIRASLKNLPDASLPQQAVPQPYNPNQLSNGSTATTVQGNPVSPDAPPPALTNPQSQLSPADVQRLLQTSYQPLSLPSDTPAMTMAQSPSTTYPQLNANTARTRVQPTQFQNSQAVVSPGARPVTPSGQVLTPVQRFLEAGDLDKTITNPSTNDLKRAIAGMRKKLGQ